jgi:hypothetical protein
MESQFIIYIGIYKLLGLIAAIISGAWYLAYRLGKVEAKIDGIGVRVDGLESRVNTMEGRLDNAFTGRSPIALLEKGELILAGSGLKDYIDSNKAALFERCRIKNDINNPYDIQNVAFKFFDHVEFPMNLENRLKTFAYGRGISMEVIRRVGAIYFRDLCLEALNMKR